VNANQFNDENWYCITMIRQGKLDKWLEKLRSQLLSFQYRQIKESFGPFIDQLMLEMNQIQKYKENLTIFSKMSHR
jgi:predicted transcriptional regulator